MRISTVSGLILLAGSMSAGHAIAVAKEPAKGVSAEWTVETVDGTPDLAAVWASPEGDVWVAGPKGVVRHKADGGWLPADKLPAPLDWVDVHGTSAKDVWAVGSAGGLIHWDGRRWSGIPGVDEDPYVAVASTPSLTAAINDDSAAVGDAKGWVYATGEGRPKGLRGLAVLDEARFLAVGTNGLAIRMDGRGGKKKDTPTWTAEKTGVADTLNGAAACPGGEAVVVGVAAARRTSAGKWTRLPAPPVEVHGAVARCKGKKLERVAAVAGDEVLILDVSGGKKSWSRQQVKAGATLTDIAPLGAGLIVAGAGGLVATVSSW